jgi:hypothetical protein
VIETLIDTSIGARIIAYRFGNILHFIVTGKTPTPIFRHTVKSQDQCAKQQEKTKHGYSSSLEVDRGWSLSDQRRLSKERLRDQSIRGINSRPPRAIKK